MTKVLKPQRKGSPSARKPASARKPTVSRSVRAGRPKPDFQVTGQVANDRFEGFGAQLNPWMWTPSGRKAGFTETNSKRMVNELLNLAPQHTRIFVPTEIAWDPSHLSPEAKEKISSFVRT